MSDAIPNDPAGEWGDLDETAWQQMHAGTAGPIGPVELGMLADSHAALAKLHKDDAGLFADHTKRAAELRKLNVGLAWFTLHRSPRPPLINDQLEQDLMAELLGRQAHQRLPSGLNAHYFGDPVHVAIYGAMQRCYAAKAPCNLDYVADDMRDRPDLDEVGGTAYLRQLLLTKRSPPINVDAAARTISETAHARWLLGRLDEITSLVRSQEEAIPIDLASGAGRLRAHLVAMELIGIAYRMLDQSAGWA